MPTSSECHDTSITEQKNINKLKVVIDDREHYLNGWIRTTAISSLQYRLIDPGLELMLNVDNLHEYLEQVHCLPLVDYKPTVILDQTQTTQINKSGGGGRGEGGVQNPHDDVPPVARCKLQ